MYITCRTYTDLILQINFDAPQISIGNFVILWSQKSEEKYELKRIFKREPHLESGHYARSKLWNQQRPNFKVKNLSSIVARSLQGRVFQYAVIWCCSVSYSVKVITGSNEGVAGYGMFHVLYSSHRSKVTGLCSHTCTQKLLCIWILDCGLISTARRQMDNIGYNISVFLNFPLNFDRMSLVNWYGLFRFFWQK